MDLWSTLRVLLHRWYLTVPLVVLSVVLVVAVVGVKPADYKADATLVTLAPQQVNEQGQQTEANPFANLGGSQSVAAAIMQTRLNGPAFQQAMAAKGVQSTWLFVVGDSSSPILTVTVKGPDRSRDPPLGEAAREGRERRTSPSSRSPTGRRPTSSSSSRSSANRRRPPRSTAAR